jgi:hypothetical protein
MSLNRAGTRVIRFAFIPLFVFTGVLILARHSSTARAQETHVPVHVTTDWSTRHVVFSAPATSAQANKLQKNQRYIQQQVIRQNGASNRVAR